ncbi:MAG: 50S ribosomal protein L29 [Micrococcaceae bacterium]
MAELRSQDSKELTTELAKHKEELFNLRFQAATGQLENSARLKTVKKEIARIYTILRERELGIGTDSAETETEETTVDDAKDEK